jgi:hypothetical protein
MQAFKYAVGRLFLLQRFINSKRFKLHEYQIKIIFVNTASKIVVVLNHIIGHQSEAVLENNLIKQLWI